MSFFLSRRTFSQAAIPATFLLRRAPMAAAQTSMPSSLPSPIAELTSMRDGVRPITNEEREARMEQARRLMNAAKLQGIMLAGGTSLRYFTGVHWGNSERLFALVLPAGNSKAICVCPAFEEARANEQLTKGPLSSAQVDLRTWNEDEDPFSLLAKALQEHGLGTGTLGVEERVPFVFSNRLAQAAPSLALKSAIPVTAGCRGVKSAHELELMTRANKATLTVYKAVYHSLHPGMTQDDASALLSAAYKQVGFPGEASVQVGKYTALPHGSTTPQVIAEGTPVMIDDGCTVEGYYSDVTRTFVLGKATDKMKRVFDVVHKAQATALETAKPGVPCEAVDAAARKVIADAGFGPGYKFFGHRLGHGIGMDMHEWPYLVGGNDMPLAAHMTFSDEPGVYLPDEFGIRLEDDMHITEDGAQLFTPASPFLEQPFG